MSAATRATWVWTRPAPDALVAFAVSRRVGDLFVAVTAATPDNREEMAWLRGLQRAAQGWGLSLSALGGDPGWCDETGEATAWMLAAQRIGVFTDYHLDVEPWAHCYWDSDRPSVVRGYLQCLDAVCPLVPPEQLEVDLAWHLDTVPAEGGTLLEAVLRRTPRLTVMAYRTQVDGPDSILSTSAGALCAAERIGGRVRVGVDTTQGPRPPDPRLTFYGRPESHLEAALTAVERQLRSSTAYAGMAVHDQAGWVALPG